MSKLFYDSQTPIYRNSDKTRTITLDNSNNQLIITNTNIPKTIIINSEEFSNGIQTLPYTQMYAKINAVDACVYPAPNATTLQVQDTILLTNSGVTGPTGQIKMGASTFDISSSQNIVIDPSTNLVVDGTLDMSLNNITRVNTIEALTSLTITDSNYNAVLLSNELNISDDVGETSSLTNAELNIQDASGNSSVLNKTSLTIGDGVISTILNNNKLQFNNATISPFIECNSSNQLWLENGNTYPIILNSSNSQITIGDVSNNGNFTKIAVDDTTRKTELNSVDILSDCNIVGSSYTLPINFTNKFNGSYTLNNSNSWEMVASNTIKIPLGLYTQTNGFNIWKMDFAINCVNMTVQYDKAYAMYIEIRDVNGSGNDYQGWLFNQTTPYTTWKNPSTYNNTSNTSENYVYTDYYEFSGATGSPLEIRLFRYGDNPMSCNFSWLLTLSKTNLV